MVDIVALAKELGFDQVGAINASDVVTSAELSAACNPQSCEKYNTCWTCQPAAGPFEEIREAHIASKKAGVIVQTVRDDIDYWEDWELVAETRTLHNSRLDRLAAMLREEFDGVLEFSTGGCDVCGECSYPDAPCKRPDEQRMALSAHGVSVGATCQNAGVDYSFENGRLRYVGMILHD